MNSTSIPTDAPNRIPPAPAGLATPTESEAATGRDRATRIICLDRPGSPLARAHDVLKRGDLEVYYPTRALTAIALCKRKRSDLVFIAYPIADMHLANFLEQMQSGLSPSSQPRIVVFAPAGELDGLTGAKLKVLNPAATFAETEAMILDEINEPRRAAVRLMARLEARLGDSPILRLCQTRDISTDGVFVATDRRTPLGTEMRLELTLDPNELPIATHVEVVRHAHPDEEAAGLGLRFVRFEEGGRERLEAFLARPSLWL